jgi:hypothetical protein
LIFEDIKFAIFIVLSIGLALVAIVAIEVKGYSINPWLETPLWIGLMVFIGIFGKKATGSWKFLLIPIGIFILKALVKL